MNSRLAEQGKASQVMFVGVELAFPCNGEKYSEEGDVVGVKAGLVMKLSDDDVRVYLSVYVT